MKLLQKRSPEWLYVLLAIFILNIASFVAYQLILDIPLSLSTLIGFKGLSIVIAIIASLGYFGFAVFSLSFIIADIIGLCYMFFIIITEKSNGWADLTSIAALATFLFVGIIVGILLQIIYFIFNNKKR